MNNINKNKESSKKLESSFQNSMPYAMLYGNGGEFNGNKYTDLFRFWIYYFVKITSNYFYKNKIKTIKQKNQEYTSAKILFVTRDWGTETTLNREIFRSLIDYCGADSVEHHELRRYDDLVPSIDKALNVNLITHVLFDTRITITSDNFTGIVKALYSSYALSRLLVDKGVVGLCGVTDWIQPGNRLLAELASSKGGVVISWASVGFHEVPRFRNDRRIGPLFTPISFETLTALEQNPNDKLKYDIAIMGNDYEPRRSLINNLIPTLKNNNIEYYLNTKKNLPYLEYLKIYQKSKIGFNTNWVAMQPQRYHFVGRNFEVLIAGCLLLTQKCFGLDLYMQDGVDYVSFENEQDLVEKIKYYLNNEFERKKIATSGHNKVLNLMKNQFVWFEIEKALYTFNYLELPKKGTQEIFD